MDGSEIDPYLKKESILEVSHQEHLQQTLAEEDPISFAFKLLFLQFVVSVAKSIHSGPLWWVETKKHR